MTVIEVALIGWTAAKPHLDLFGTLGLLLGFAAGIIPHRRGMLLSSAGCATAFGLHYLHLGALTGTSMCAVALVQSLASVRAIGPEGRATWVAPLFAATTLVAAGLTLVTWSGWLSAFAGLGALLATAARLQSDPQGMRRLFLGASLCWAVHNGLVGSVFGLTCDLLTLSGLILSLVRHQRRSPAAHALPAT